MAYLIHITPDECTTQVKATAPFDPALHSYLTLGVRVFSELASRFRPDIIVMKAAKGAVEHTDFLPIGPNWTVSERFRDLLESLEPGVHQFLPMRLIDIKGNEIGRPYFLLNILNKIECIIVEKSDVKYVDYNSPIQPGNTRKMLLDTKNPASLTLNKRMITGSHLWQGHLFYTSRVFVSDTLYKLINENGLVHLRSQYCSED